MRHGIQKVEGGFPHSEILGSKLVRSSPRLIAAYHVLHRLSAPRHPPDALKTLDYSHDRCPLYSARRHRHKERPASARHSPKLLLAKSIRSASLRAGVVAKGSRPSQPNEFPLHDFKHPRQSTRPARSSMTSRTIAQNPTPEEPLKERWWSQTGSNRRPPECKSGALPAELWPPDQRPDHARPGLW